MKTKRILFVTDFYNPYNGMGKFIIDISKIFKKNNFRVIILTVKTENNLNKIERDNGTIIFRSSISFKFSRGTFQPGRRGTSRRNCTRQNPAKAATTLR